MIQKLKDKYPAIFELIRFGLVGVLNTLLDLVIYSLIVYSGVFWQIAKVISYAIAVAFSYFVNKYWTFKQKGGFSFIELAKMYGVNIFSLVISILLIAFFINIVKVPELTIYSFVIKNSILANIFTIPFVVCINFIGSKFFVFGKNNKNGDKK